MIETPAHEPVHWKKGLSWSMFNAIDGCGKQAEYRIADRHEMPRLPRDTDWPTFYADRGTIVQFIYEMYFNQQVNLRKGGQNPDVIGRVIEKVIASDWCRKVLDATTYPDGKTEAMLLQDVRKAGAAGFKSCYEAGILSMEVRSELATPGYLRTVGPRHSEDFKGIPIFAYIDFVAFTPRGALIYDGKINAAMDADPRQLVFSALALEGRFSKSGGRVPVIGGGFLYWKHGKYKPVDLSTEAKRAFIDGDWLLNEERLFQLRKGDGAIGWPTTNGAGERASYKTCRYCPWKVPCPDAHRGKERPEPTFDQAEMVTF